MKVFKKKQKKIFWLVEDKFEGLAYDKQIKVLKQISDVVWLAQVERFEKNPMSNKIEQNKTTMLVQKVKEYEGVVFVKWLDYNEL